MNLRILHWAVLEGKCMMCLYPVVWTGFMQLQHLLAQPCPPLPRMEIFMGLNVYTQVMSMYSIEGTVA